MTTKQNTFWVNVARNKMWLIAIIVLGVLVLSGVIWIMRGGGGVWLSETAKLPAEMPTQNVGQPPQTSANLTTDNDVARVLDTPIPPTSTDIIPSFDLVRVDAGGSAVIAGQAAAGSTVRLLLDDEPLDMVQTDADGNFVALLVLDPANRPRVLRVEALLDMGAVVPGNDTVVIAPFEAADTALPDLDTANSADDAPPISVGVGDGVAQTPTTDPAEERTPTDNTLIGTASTTGIDEREGSSPHPPSQSVAGASDRDRVVHMAGPGPDAQTEIWLDAISYDIAGDVTLAGRGTAASDVRIFLNNHPIQLGEIGPEGNWRLSLPHVDPGTYTLRIEQTSQDGVVEAEIETPFLREDPARIISNPMLVAEDVFVITVQPDFTLWGIARANFGDGLVYHQIFQENRSDIADPDLIYPGQIFQLPDLPRALADQE